MENLSSSDEFNAFKCNFFWIGVNCSCDKMLSVKIPYFKKQEKHQVCVIDFVSHRGITFILIGRSAIHLVCILNAYLS